MITHSFDIKQIAQYASEQDAQVASSLATVGDTEGKYTYKVSYSPRASRWLVSVRDAHGNMHGYIHPIQEE